jgi:hypothetical protein
VQSTPPTQSSQAVVHCLEGMTEASISGAGATDSAPGSALVSGDYESFAALAGVSNAGPRQCRSGQTVYPVAAQRAGSAAAAQQGDIGEGDRELWEAVSPSSRSNWKRHNSSKRCVHPAYSRLAS